VSEVRALCKRLNLESSQLIGLHPDRLFDIRSC
jgi:hypothetical protein